MISIKTDGLYYLDSIKEGVHPVAATMEDSSMYSEDQVIRG